MAKLTERQQEVADKIIRIGKERGATKDQIKWALKSAKIESSLGAQIDNIPVEGKQKTSAKGVFQYVKSSWEKHTGDPKNDEDNINAFYKDLQRIDNRYDKHVRERIENPENYNNRNESRKVPEHITKDEYRYIKHHDGNSANKDSFKRGGMLNGNPKGIDLYDKERGKPASDNADNIATEILNNANGYEEKSYQQEKMEEMFPSMREGANADKEENKSNANNEDSPIRDASSSLQNNLTTEQNRALDSGKRVASVLASEVMNGNIQTSAQKEMHGRLTETIGRVMMDLDDSFENKAIIAERPDLIRDKNLRGGHTDNELSFKGIKERVQGEMQTMARSGNAEDPSETIKRAVMDSFGSFKFDTKMTTAPEQKEPEHPLWERTGVANDEELRKENRRRGESLLDEYNISQVKDGIFF